LKSDEAGLWFARRDIRRVLVPRDGHLNLIDVHGRLLRELMQKLRVACEAEGLDVAVTELALEAFAALNSTLEYGGFSPSQCRTGANPPWGEILFPETDDTGEIFSRPHRLRGLANCAAQEAIYQEKISRGARTRGAQAGIDDFPIGTEVEFHSKKENPNKDLPSWKGPATVKNNDDPENIIVDFGGVLKGVPLHLIRLSPDDLNLFMHCFYGDAVDVGIFMNETEVITARQELEKLVAVIHPGKFETRGVLMNSMGMEIAQHMDTAEDVLLVRRAREYALEALGLAYVAGVRVWSCVKKLPPIPFGGYGVAIAWPVMQPADSTMATVNCSRPLEVNKTFEISQWSGYAGMLFYTFYDNLLDNSEKLAKQEWDEVNTEYGDPLELDPIYEELDEDVESNPDFQEADEGIPSSRFDNIQIESGICPRRSSSRELLRLTRRGREVATQTQRRSNSSAAKSAARPTASSMTQTSPKVPSKVPSKSVGAQAGSGVASSSGAPHPLVTGAKHGGSTIGGALGGTLGGALAGPIGEALGSLGGEAMGERMAQAAAKAVVSRLPSMPQLVIPQPPIMGKMPTPAPPNDGQLYLPGIPGPVTPEQYADPGELEVEIESIQCPALMVEVFPNGCPEEIRGQVFHADDFLTDPKSGICYRVEQLTSGELTKEDIEKHPKECAAARRVELLSWHDNRAFKLTERKMKKIMKAMTARWLYTRKKDQFGNIVIKARLCLRGFMDLQAALMAVAAATASMMVHRVFAAVAVTIRAIIMSLDVGSAFLKGITFEQLNNDPLFVERREAFFTLPDESDYQLLFDIDPSYYAILLLHWLEELVVECLKGGYGLKDAPLLWRKELHAFLISLGFVKLG